jgi:FkbM family methyltransferase
VNDADAPVIVTKEGVHVLRDDTHLSRWIEEHGRLDIAEPQIAHYKHLIPEGGVVVDAGASLGDHALTYAKLVGSKGAVWAFEPHPITFAALKLNMENQPNVTVLNLALSDRAEEGVLTRNANVGASFVRPAKNGDVNCFALDYWRHHLGRCNLIHLDVEGREGHVIDGASWIIQKYQPAIVLEINHACLEREGWSEDRLRELLDSKGYVISELEPGLHSGLPQRDVLALPK